MYVNLFNVDKAFFLMMELIIDLKVSPIKNKTAGKDGDGSKKV